ncbi:MAG: HAD-IIIA family hydrolase [Desulfamplus sp.]|nr:HAD-IIIA family hydrolase [Desulfamplus sp.]
MPQAVILAGGRGTRLKPLTDSTPKPMIEFNGKPFLEHLISFLSEHGVNRILLLLGYLPDKIIDHFGNGHRFNVNIEYSISDEINDTGKRIKLAEASIEQNFLLMYCDNYVPLPLGVMLKKFINRGFDGQITVYSNKDEYTRSNLSIDDDGVIVQYDKSRLSNGLQGVDIGFAFFKKSILKHLPDDNVNFESIIYPLLVQKRQLSAYVTDHRYYSVGSFDRLDLTKAFFDRQPAIFLDRDGVLNKKAPKAEYISDWDQFKWLDGALEALKLLKIARYRIIIITNQAGIARGMVSESSLLKIHENMIRDAVESGGGIDAVYYCPHGWDDDCDCRKPKPGLLYKAQRKFHLDLSKIFFIGDDVRDQKAAVAAGCKSILVSLQYSLLKAVKEKILIQNS